MNMNIAAAEPTPSAPPIIATAGKFIEAPGVRYTAFRAFLTVRGLFDHAVCGDDCQAMGMSTGNSTWEAREIVFLALELCAFFALSMGIFQKRQSMSSKELLIEQATAAHFDMKRIHLVGGCLGTLIIVVCFAAAKLVSATLGFMLALDLGALFYLLKLTLF